MPLLSRVCRLFAVGRAAAERSVSPCTSGASDPTLRLPNQTEHPKHGRGARKYSPVIVRCKYATHGGSLCGGSRRDCHHVDAFVDSDAPGPSSSGFGTHSPLSAARARIHILTRPSCGFNSRLYRTSDLELQVPDAPAPRTPSSHPDPPRQRRMNGGSPYVWDTGEDRSRSPSQGSDTPLSRFNGVVVI